MPEGLPVALPSWKARLSRIGYSLTLPRVVIGLSLAFLLFLLVVIPFFRLVQETAVWHPADVRLSGEARPGEWTLFHWKRTLLGPISSNLFYRPFVRSLETSLAIGIAAVLLGSLVAWLVARTDLPAKRFVAAVAVIPYVLPSYTLALAWLNAFRTERVGGGAGAYHAFFGIDPPEWLAYGFLPIVVTMTLHYYPFAYLMVSGALASVDAQLEEAGEVLGAGRWAVLRRVSFPLILPAILSAFILTFSRALGTFGTPYFLGAPVRYFTLPTMIYSSMVTRSFADGYILALALIAVSAVVIALNQRLLGVRRGFVTIGGKGFRARVTPLGPWRWPAGALVMALIAVAVFLPLGLLAWQTFMRYPDDYALGNLTLHYWIGQSDEAIAEGEAGILRNSLILGAVWNSAALSVVVALLTGAMGMLLGYAIAKGRGGVLSRLLEQESFLPYLIPSIAFGAIYLAIFTQPIGPVPALYGTFLLLVLVCLAKNVPFAARASIASAMQVAGELEEAATVAGASWIRRFKQIVFPLMLRGSLPGFLLTFIATMRELSLIILLVTPSTRTLTTMTFRYTEQGYAQFADAIIVLIIFLVLAGDWVARRLGRAGAEHTG